MLLTQKLIVFCYLLHLWSTPFENCTHQTLYKFFCLCDNLYPVTGKKHSKASVHHVWEKVDMICIPLSPYSTSAPHLLLVMRVWRHLWGEGQKNPPSLLPVCLCPCELMRFTKGFSGKVPTTPALTVLTRAIWRQDAACGPEFRKGVVLRSHCAAGRQWKKVGEKEVL